ncbi:hypothetical protein [Shimia haliotis]|uniref:MetA-pathway of phenol degradation n=1 Tax=Shimia haliotis TaxID=1280847 RepID=A0A1I4AR11_9RHOB|nr:hypothetical protein [Shimia haliotis]SFK58972.1 hypothetical protein SAMN04488036_101546 [Shimia haliotis]
MIFEQRILRGSAVARAVAGLVLAGSSAVAQDNRVVLENTPTRMRGFETAQTYHAGTLELSVGTSQTSPGSGPGTGLQTYYGGGSYALSDRFMFGLEFQDFNDPAAGPINGSTPLIEMSTLALWGKMSLYQGERLSVAGLASIESVLNLRSPIWNGSVPHFLIGAIKAPISYQVNDSFALHLTPGVTFMPDSVNGRQFYGDTIGSVGVGASWKAGRRLSFGASVEAPISGTNTIASDGSYKKVPVWTVSGRYNVTPKTALEGYVTNGYGMTPATSILTFWPVGDEVLAGLRLIYTPGAARPDSYRGVAAPVTPAQKSLQLDGFTLGGADTLEPGTLRFSGWYGSDNNAGVLLGFSPDRDGEIQLIFEQYSDNPTASAGLVPTTDVRFMIGPKLRFMDQNNGNAFSLAGRALYGRRITGFGQKTGVFFAEAMASYQAPNGRAVFTANPKIAAFGNTEIAGVGLGVNIRATDTLDLIAEVTPVALDGSTPTWAAGLRYQLGDSGLSVDAQATNAIGRFGIGSMVAQDDLRVSVMLSKTFGVTGLKFY